MNISHLHYFCDAARLGSVAAAARKHRVSPSAVSQAIRALEQHFGFVLTKHERTFALTAEGETLAAHAPELFAAASAIDDAMTETRDKFAGKVAFATQQSIAHALLPEFFSTLSHTYPLMQPHLRLGTTTAVQTWLQADDIELALSVDNVAFDDFASATLIEGEFILVRAAASTKALASESFIVTEKTRERQLFCREFERIHGRPAPIAMEIASWSVVRRMAECGLGIGLIPDYVLADGSSTLERCDLGIPRMPYRISAYFRSRRGLSRLARALLAELEKHLKQAQTTWQPR